MGIIGFSEAAAIVLWVQRNLPEAERGIELLRSAIDQVYKSGFPSNDRLIPHSAFSRDQPLRPLRHGRAFLQGPRLPRVRHAHALSRAHRGLGGVPPLVHARCGEGQPLPLLLSRRAQPGDPLPLALGREVRGREEVLSLSFCSHHLLILLSSLLTLLPSSMLRQATDRIKSAAKNAETKKELVSMLTSLRTRMRTAVDLRQAPYSLLFFLLSYR